VRLPRALTTALAATGKAIHHWHDSIQQDRVGLAMLIVAKHASPSFRALGIFPRLDGSIHIDLSSSTTKIKESLLDGLLLMSRDNILLSQYLAQVGSLSSAQR